ncbi:uncharacterized protein LOC143890509 [Tasmannia lanceolata]|uniref:uncharacterized protein LOC143890509 n=1 Tax=Tasmannia lanceolata TaxID=3420 RepID=UPI004063DD24
MASGSSGRTASGSKGFDFGTDDVLCSYDDFGKQDLSNGNRTDSAKRKDFWDNRIGRPLVDVYNQQDDSRFKDVIATVEKTMKKYADSILQFLEGISRRVSQLELYCCDLERSIGELRSEYIIGHDNADGKLRSLEKHLQEVHRSIQILRDKQELADTQKELAKLHLVQKESTTMTHSNQIEDGVASSASDPRKHDNSADAQNQQLALALPSQAATPTSLPIRAAEQLSQPYKELPIQQLPPPSLSIHAQTQPNAYYSSQTQLPIQPPQAQQHQQDQLQYVPQMQDPSRQAPVSQPHVNQTQTQQFPLYQQQWSQQSPQQFPRQVQPQDPSPQSQIRPQTPPVYPPYPHQPANPSPETFPGSIPTQVFSGISQSGVNRPDSGVYGYPQQPAPPNIQRQPQPQTNPSIFGAHISDGGYPGSAPHPQNIPGYMMYDTGSNRPPHPPQFQQGSYPPTRVPALLNQPPPTGNVAVQHPSSQLMRNHPYSELMEKAMSMGYGRDHVASVILRMEESGQPLDFNELLDRLDVHATGASHRGWSG